MSGINKNFIIRRVWREDEHRRIVASDRLPFVDSGPYSSDSIATKRPTLVFLDPAGTDDVPAVAAAVGRRLPTIRISIPRCHRVVTDALYNAKGRPNVNGKRVNGRVSLGVNAFELRRRRVVLSLVSYFSPAEKERQSDREREREREREQATAVHSRVNDGIVPVHPRLHVYKLSNLVDESVPGPLFLVPSSCASCRPLRYVSAEEEGSTPTFVRPNHAVESGTEFEQNSRRNEFY